MSNNKLKVGILGATGSVGQRFVKLLENHPWFEITELVASEKSAGKPYAEAVGWKQDSAIPSSLSRIIVKEPNPEKCKCDFVFSGLDSSVAGEIEEKYAITGIPVISNSRNHRFDQDVPLIIPEVNPDHIGIIPYQKKFRGYKSGFIVTNPNCSTTGLALALKPIHDAFTLEKIVVVTMQAVSGAGYPGLPSMDILDNVVPFINGEEEKMETEPNKIFAKLINNRFTSPNIKITASCNRVGVTDGHMESVFFSIKKKAEDKDIIASVTQFSGIPWKLKLPSAPEKPIILKMESDRPQTRLDRNEGKGMSVNVGRIRKDPIFGFKMSILSHNTVRGAAGGAILNAELLRKKGYL